LKLKKDLPYYLIILFICSSFKVFFAHANYTELDFLLKPTDAIVGLLSGSSSQFIPDRGYFHKEINILIEKSCAGINFGLICFMMLSYFSIKFISDKRYRLISLPVILLICYCFTLGVNVVRIVLSMLVQNMSDNFLVKRPHLLIHNVFGHFIYLFFLIIIYIGFDFLLNKIKQAHEKLT
jgi:exosortase K